jgi:hypothetical protein
MTTPPAWHEQNKEILAREQGRLSNECRFVLRGPHEGRAALNRCATHDSYWFPRDPQCIVATPS